MSPSGSVPPRPTPVIVGLDVGTTGVKAAAFGLDSGWDCVAIREYPLLAPSPVEAVQDPARIVDAVEEALAECVAAVGSTEVLAVSVSAGMHALMALDADLRPITPLVTWADSRAREEAAALRRSPQGLAMHERTGAPVHPMTPLVKLLWFARHAPKTWAAARWWVGLKDYVLLALTGELATELSSASGTGLLDMWERTWSAEALALCELDVDRLPRILPPTAALSLKPGTADRVGLPAGTTVVAGAADGPLANLGTGALSPGTAGLSLGTSGAVRMATDAPHVDAEHTLFCYALTDSIWVIGGALSNGGVVLRWAESSLLPDIRSAAGGVGVDAAVLEMAASVPAGSDGLVMLPYLLAERAPLWDPGLPGAYLGLRREHTRAHFVRACIEGVCLQMRLILDRLDDAEPVGSVRATGGVFRAPLWREVMAAMLARPIEFVADAEGTALGAAALGLFALGGAPTLQEAAARLWHGEGAPAATVEPDPRAVEAYDEIRASVPDLVHALDRVGALFS